MKHLTLARSYLTDKTAGILFDDNIKLATLERPWLDNAPTISCIPEGTYIVKRDKMGKYQWFAVQNVANRTFIELHEGNKVSNSAGCILVGIKHSTSYDIERSIDGLNELLYYVRDSAFLLTIRASRGSDW